MLESPNTTPQVADLIVAWRLGAISFMDLIEEIERLLQIQPEEQKDADTSDSEDE